MRSTARNNDVLRPLALLPARPPNTVCVMADHPGWTKELFRTSRTDDRWPLGASTPRRKKK